MKKFIQNRSVGAMKNTFKPATKSILLSFQITWRCQVCGLRGAGAVAEEHHRSACEAAEARKHLEKIDGFIKEVQAKGQELREIDNRFWSYVHGVKRK